MQQNTPNYGSTHPHTASHPAPQAPQTALTTHKILIIEDDIDVQEMVIAFFRQKGFETIGYDNPEMALKDLAKDKIKVDAIITDLKLPSMSGIDFIRKFRETDTSEIPIIVATSNRAVETAIEAIQVGAFDFVVKPLHFPQLLVSIERALHFSKLKSENQTLKAAIHTKEGTGLQSVIGKSPNFLRALELAKRVAPSHSNVFICGESGTGKEVIARSIHNLSTRAKAPFVAINCSAIPENLLESELFGYAKGAFTGAIEKKIGLFEEAEGGTLFLDEIGDMNIQLQSKLLRVLQERKIKRIGENQMRDIDVRIISATHKDLKKEMQENRFREDLFFRLNVIPIYIPPLRERVDDVIPLAEFFLKKYSAMNHFAAKGFSKFALEKLLRNPWKGNVRELENTVERAIVLSQGRIIEADDLLDFFEGAPAPHTESAHFNVKSLSGESIMPADTMMKLYIKHVLEKNSWAKEKTAKDLEIDRKTLYRKLQEMRAENMI
jgi:two-component system, NtrC family, response regulator HydG